MEASEGSGHRVYRTKIDGSGRIVLPIDMRSDLGVAEGDSILLVQEGDTVEVRTVPQVLREAQDYFCRLVPAGVNLVDELLAERRAEAENE